MHNMNSNICYNFYYIRLYSIAFLIFFVAMLSGCDQRKKANIFQGYVEGEYVYVASPFAGRLEKLMVLRGQIVQPTAMLYSLEAVRETKALARAEHDLNAQEAILQNLRLGKRPRELDVIRAQLAAARIAEAHSGKQQRRREELSQRRAVSQEKVEDAQSSHAADNMKVRELAARLDVAALPARKDEIAYQEAMVKRAEASLAEARWQLEQKSPLAPFGNAPWYLVVDTLFREGEWVAAGTPVVKLLPPDKVKVRFFVPEEAMNNLQVGQEVRVLLDGREEPVPCRISFIGEEAEYTPPVIYSNDTREKMIFFVEARPEALQADAEGGKKNPQLPGRLRPGQPVAVELP